MYRYTHYPNGNEKIYIICPLRILEQLAPNRLINVFNNPDNPTTNTLLLLLLYIGRIIMRHISSSSTYIRDRNLVRVLHNKHDNRTIIDFYFLERSSTLQSFLPPCWCALKPLILRHRVHTI